MHECECIQEQHELSESPYYRRGSEMSPDPGHPLWQTMAFVQETDPEYGGR